VADRKGGLRICLLGHGAMARSLEAWAGPNGYTVTAVFSGDDLREGKPRRRGDLRGAEVGIDFSAPAAVFDNVRRAMDLELPLVEGTTGWGTALPDVQAAVINANGALLHAPNFAFGMNVLFHLLEQAADIFEGTPDVDPWVSEHHHRGKRDMPSGTALRIAETLLDRFSRKNLLQVGPTSGAIADNQLSVASLRAGWEPGAHRVGFDGPHETLELVHHARHRHAFSEGALRAADWLKGRQGVFTMRDYMREILAEAAERRRLQEEQHG
jgi:4-hydroxy-tetrahydrodipicolinate reductase